VDRSSLSRLTNLGVQGALVFAAILVLMLGRANRTLRDQNEELLHRVRTPQPGHYVPLISGITQQGDTVILGGGRDEEVELLFFFSTTCPFCRETIPAWNQIAESVGSRSGIQVVGVALDTPDQVEVYSYDRGLRFDVLPLADRRNADLFGARAVPLTMVVGADGRIGYARQGPISMQVVVDSVLNAVDRLKSSSNGPG